MVVLEGGGSYERGTPVQLAADGKCEQTAGCCECGSNDIVLDVCSSNARSHRNRSFILRDYADGANSTRAVRLNRELVVHSSWFRVQGCGKEGDGVDSSCVISA